MGEHYGRQGSIGTWKISIARVTKIITSWIWSKDIIGNRNAQKRKRNVWKVKSISREETQISRRLKHSKSFWTWRSYRGTKGHRKKTSGRIKVKWIETSRNSNWTSTCRKENSNWIWRKRKIKKIRHIASF